MSLSKPIIEIRDMGKTFHTKGGDVVALDGINLDIQEGEIFGIIGLSGAGKSTLVRCINFLEVPTSGNVIFDGKDLGALTPKELRTARTEMGMIFQSFNLLMQRTALQNICFPLEISKMTKADAKKRAMELLEIVGLADRADAYPAQLSGGQKQRVAIARALASNPKVILCDEATSALDPTTTRGVLELLQKINREMGVTVVIITHEMSVIEEICHRVAIIDKSYIQEIGDVSEIFSNPKTDIAKQLIFPEGNNEINFGGHCVRIIFDGHSSFEPVISNMVMECGIAINILYADTRNINGNAVGQMLVQLPDNKKAVSKALAYLTAKGVQYKEEQFNG